MGRRRRIEEMDISVKELYEEYNSSPEVTLSDLAVKYGINRKTLGRYFRDAGYSVARGMKHGQHKKHENTGAIDKYVREHQDVELPRSPSEMVKMIPNCTIDAAKSWRKRRKKDFIERVKKLPNLRKTSIAFKIVDENGKERLIRLRDFSSYRLSADWESQFVRIQGDHKEFGPQSFRVHLARLETNLGQQEQK